jgi:HAD superfamily hydrolase (TIGR01509 family)
VSELPAAVLWDLDGTLVDTEPYWMSREFALVAEHGERWTEADAHSLVGNDLLVSARALRDRGGVRLEPEEIVAYLLEGVVEQTRAQVPWRPGARELLAALRAQDVPCALVTMSYRQLADTVVAALPPDTFATLVTGDQLRRGKPFPDAYEEAARRLGRAPEECLAIEDSLTGVTSAEAAGVPVLAVRHLVAVPEAPGRRVIDSLTGVGVAQLRAWHEELLGPLG